MNIAYHNSHKIKVAIIDDGFDWHTSKKFHNAHTYFYEVKNGKIKKQRGIYHIYLSSHGTRCLAIYANTVKNLSPYDIYCIKALKPNTRYSSIDDLETALLWCLNNNISIISISLGTTYYKDYDRLRDIVQRLISNGTIIVAAHSNENLLSFPASFSSVIGVRCDYANELLQEEQYILLQKNLSNIDIISSCKYSNLNSVLDDEIDNYNSYATPYIAALVHKGVINGYNSLSKALYYLDLNKTKINNFCFWKYLKPILKISNEVTIPVVGIISIPSKKYMHDVMESLASYFRKDDYNASIICDYSTDDDRSFNKDTLHTFGLDSLYEMSKFIAYYTQANLLLVEVSMLYNNIDYSYFDLLLGEKSNVDISLPYICIKNQSPEQIYEKIKEIFT